MEAVILGSGNVAEALAEAMTAQPGHGVGLVQICARGAKGREFAGRMGVPFTESPGTMAEADIYIMAVSDNAITELSAAMRVPGNAVVAHTAGGVGMGAISGNIRNRAVFYPLQTFTRGRGIDFREIPVFIEYDTPDAGVTVRMFAESLSGRVYEAGSDLRVRLHTAAVFACNFTNHLYALGNGILAEAGLPFDILKPIIRETASKAVWSEDPALVQTGPAARGDKATMQRHIDLLRSEGKGNYEEIYKLLSDDIWATSKKTSQE